MPSEAKNDPVNHPRHYTAHPSGVECITVTEHMTFNVGNAVKYLWRAGLKGATIQDLQKARWYIDREIQRMERGPDPILADFIATAPPQPEARTNGEGRRDAE